MGLQKKNTSKHEQQITAPTPDTLIPRHRFLNFGKCFPVPHHHHVHDFPVGYQKNIAHRAPAAEGEGVNSIKAMTESVVKKEDTIKQGCIEVHPF